MANSEMLQDVGGGMFGGTLTPTLSRPRKGERGKKDTRHKYDDMWHSCYGWIGDSLGRVNTKSQGFDNQGPDDKSGEQHIEFVEAAKDPAVGLQTAEKPLNFIAAAIHHPVICPRNKALGIGGYHRHIPQVIRQTPRFIAFVSPVHDQVTTRGNRTARLQQFPALGRIARLACGELEPQRAARICGNHMNLGRPSAARASDGLRAVFFKAPVPSGWTLMIVLSRHTCSIRMAKTCSFCNSAKTRFKTPALLQRFMRV